MAKSNKKKKVHGDQLIVGYCGSTTDLYGQVDRLIKKSKTLNTWNDLAKLIGISRPGLISSVRRDKPPMRRLCQLADALDVNVLIFIEQPVTLKENAELF